MKRVLFFIVVMSSLFSLHSNAQTYQSLWKSVEEFEKKDLPKSALGVVQKIYDKAEKEQQVPQMMKAFLTGMGYRHRISRDSLKVDKERLLEWADTTADKADQAVLYSIWADMAMGDDVKLAFDKLMLSVADVKSLKKISASDYDPLVGSGPTSIDYFNNNLYEFLARRAISILEEHRWDASRVGNQTEFLPKNIHDFESLLKAKIEPASDCDVNAAVVQTYQAMLETYDNGKERSAWLLTALDFLKYLRGTFPSFMDEGQRIALYKKWIANYPSEKALPDVYLAYCNESTLQNEQPKERLELVREAMRKFPAYENINAFKNIQGMILAPSLNLSVPASYPQSVTDVNISYQNVTGVKLYIYKVRVPVHSSVLFEQAETVLGSHATLYREEHFDLEPTSDYKEKSTVVYLQSPECGLYYIRAVPDGMAIKNSYGAYLHVTSMRVLYRALPDNRQELVVVDSESGHPVKDASVVVYSLNKKVYTQKEKIKVNEQGTVVLQDRDRNLYVHAVKAGDEWMDIEHLWTSVYQKQEEAKRSYNIKLFTDRSIYRPGQIVYVSGFLNDQFKDDLQVLPNQKIELTLIDSNWKDVEKREVKTNEFGSFSDQFTLPSGGLTGHFMIRARMTDRASVNSQTTIRMEEYKRPTFEVTFDEIKEQYQQGDSVSLVGHAKTFAGVPVQQANVHYRIERRDWWFFSNAATWDGDVTTDDEGNFTVPVKLLVEDGVPFYRRYYSFRVTAEVTSMGGETQTGTTSVPLGTTSLILQIGGLPSNREVIKENKNQISFGAYNLSHEPMQVKVHYELFKLEKRTQEELDALSAEEKAEGYLYKEVERLDEGEKEANALWNWEKLFEQPSGRYRIKIDAEDAQGRVCKESEDILLLSLNDKKLPEYKMDWWYQTGNEFDSSNPPALYIGSSEENVYLLYDIFSGNQRVESRRMMISNEIIKISYPYKPEYGDGIQVSWAFVKKGELVSRNTEFIRPRPDKKLTMKWKVFRDKLIPGQQEEWRMSIVGTDGKPAKAEMLALMYDASLNKLYGHSIDWSPYFERFIPRSIWQIKNVQGASSHASLPYHYLDETSKLYSELMIPFTRFYGRIGMLGTKGVVYDMAAPVAMNASMKRMSRMDDGIVMMAAEAQEEKAMVSNQVTDEESIQEEQSQETAVTVRENFNETAFFYPQLRTDEKGEVSIAFTLPESLTQWNFKAFAHTQSMDYGVLNETVTASKDFMLQPNMPRFVRIGDDAHITAQVMNRSEGMINGTVRMELLDPATNKVIHKESVPFQVDAEKTASVDFHFAVTEQYPMLIVRLVADGGAFSDGEQHYLPVLSNRQWITETIPFYINGKGEKAYSLESIFNKHSQTATGKKMAVELTANPAWYAVQALPALSNPENESVISWAVSYYANSLAQHISDTHPRLRQVFEQWKAEGKDKELLISQLEKNQDLKNLLLQETPWVLEAESEAAQRQRVSTLFDLNEMKNKLAVAEKKLLDLQKSDGGWSWFEGMKSNRYITTSVMEMLSRLQMLTGRAFIGEVSQMVSRAMDYLQSEAREEYERMRDFEKKNPKSDLCPSENTLDFLYIWALTHRDADPGKQTGEFKTMTDYFLDKVAKHPHALTIYGKARSSVILSDFGRKEKAQEFFQSLMEYTVYTDEMGRYYDSPSAYYSWCSYLIPTEVAAIEAVNRLTKDQQIIDEMQRWLLKQKQTQVWDTPIASVNAVYSLLNTGVNDLLANEGGVLVKVGKTMVQPSRNDALGYVKQTIPDKDMGAKELTIQKDTDGIMWGAVYAQYFEDMDKVEADGKNLTIQKELLKDGQVVNETTPLQVGDKLTVRLKVQSDRDIDFVQIKDERAACMEPIDVLSGYRWKGGLGMYQSTKDASTLFFVDMFRKGEYVIEYQVYINRKGVYGAGAATIQSAYAPEFSGRSGGQVITVL